MMAMNIGFLAMDVAGLVTGGATTIAATAAKSTLKAGVKVAAKSAAKAAAKVVGKSGLKTGTKLTAKGAGKAFKNSIDDIVRKAGKGKKPVTAKKPPKNTPKPQTWEELENLMHCFVAGTLIQTPQGSIPIELIKEGTKVYAYNITTKRVVVRNVIAIYNNFTNNLVKLSFKDDVIYCTRKHRFWNATEFCWVDAENITAEMNLLAINGNILHITNKEYLQQEMATYNFEVEDEHNYFVSSLGILVHNKGFTSSIFNSLTKVDTEIYGIFDEVIGDYVYVGKTVQGKDTRKGQHMKSKGLTDARYRVDTLKEGKWNPFQTAANEQHFIMKYKTKIKKAGAEFCNKINALSKVKFEYFKNLIQCP